MHEIAELEKPLDGRHQAQRECALVKASRSFVRAAWSRAAWYRLVCVVTAIRCFALPALGSAQFQPPPGYMTLPIASKIIQVSYLTSGGNLCQAWSVIEFAKIDNVLRYYVEYTHVASGQKTHAYRTPPLDGFGAALQPGPGKYWVSLSGNAGLTCALAEQYASDDWSNPRVVAYVPLPPMTIDVADASSRALNRFLPDAANAAALPSLDWNTTRTVTGVAADGVSLLLVRVAYHGEPDASGGSARLRVKDTDHGADPGSFWTPSDRSLIDDGALLDTQAPAAGPTEIVAPLVQDPNDAETQLAFFLYRPPRDFDGGAGTDTLQKRKITIDADILAAGDGEVLGSRSLDLDIVRPLVFLQHGTFDSPTGWQESPLFSESGNELRSPSYTGASADYPFQTDRGDFSWESGAAGRLLATAPLAWDTFNRKLDNWRRITGYAGTQADVVCHSYGGVVMRWVAQTQPDTPLSKDVGNNFRNETNWGHGAFHKLITIATTHRGSAVSNQLASLNANGLKPGLIRRVAAVQASWIDRGGVEDQMVVSPILRQLQETRVPGHMIAGSGLAEFNSNYASRLYALWFADRLDGPFKSLGAFYGPNGAPYWERFRMASNYGFNLGQALVDDTTQDPNYDLTVSSFSSKAGRVASVQSVTTPFVLGIVAGRSDLAGHFTHGDEISFGSHDFLPATAVAKRVAFLLRQPTAGAFFEHFPAAASVALTPTELAFSDPTRFDPQWLYIQGSGFPPGPAQLRARGRVGAAAAQDPVLTIDPAATTVSAGQSLQVTVAWPGEGIASGFITWPSAAAGTGELVTLTPDALSHAIVVPARNPGPFTVMAVVTSPGGTTSIASVDLEIVASTPYVALRAEPPVLTLRGTRPAAVNVYGRHGADQWTALDASSRLHLESGDPAVVMVDGGRLHAVGTGTTMVTATYDGNLSTAVQVDVAFDATSTTTSTTLPLASTTTTTLPPEDPCAALTGFAAAQCVCAAGITFPVCSADRVPAAVPKLFRNACTAMSRAGALSAAKRKKAKALVRSAGGSVKRALSTLEKAKKKKKVSPACGAVMSGAINDLGTRVAGSAAAL